MSAVDALTGSCILMRDSYIRQAILMLSLRVIIERPISRGTPDMRKLVYIVFLSLLYMLPNTAQAHHSFAAEYDIDKYITLQGTVSEVRFRNPHVQILLDVDDNGETTRWNVAGQSVAALRRRGIVADVIAVGDAVTVSGHAGRNGTKKLYLDVVITAAGVRYSIFGDDTKRAAAAAATEAVSLSASSIAAALPGHWAFDVDKTLPGAPLHLEFVAAGDGLNAIFDNEVIDVVVGEESFTMVLDRENLGGFPAQLQLTGTIVDGAIAGTVDMIAGYTNFPNLDAKTFTAARTTAEDWQADSGAQMNPVDITGVWSRKIGLGPIGRTNPQLNETGLARHREYQKGLYDPTLRCKPAGPMRKYAQPGNIEIMATTNRLTMLYANSSAIRRFWFDRAQHNPDRPHDVMGESLATWDGSTLVVETESLAEAVLTHNAEPISDEARVVERLWLDDSGDLIMEATLHDPKYYARPVVRRVQMKRSDDQDMIYSPCDPDSFYRSLQLDDALDSYYEYQPETAPAQR